MKMTAIMSLGVLCAVAACGGRTGLPTQPPAPATAAPVIAPPGTYVTDPTEQGTTREGATRLPAGSVEGAPRINAEGRLIGVVGTPFTPESAGSEEATPNDDSVELRRQSSLPWPGR